MYEFIVRVCQPADNTEGTDILRNSSSSAPGAWADCQGFPKFPGGTIRGVLTNAKCLSQQTV